jgi:hypothetical protein
MKKGALFRLILIGYGTFAFQSALAGSAVVLAPHNQMVTSYGHSREVAKQRALEEARRKYGDDVRILASSDVTGYCAIAKARHPNGNWVIGVSLGNPSATQATTLAMKWCVQAGGKNPRVIRGFRG